MIRALRTRYRESGIFEPFNPPAHHHLSPKRPDSWAVLPTRKQALEMLSRAVAEVAAAALGMGISAETATFAMGGLTKAATRMQSICARETEILGEASLILKTGVRPEA